MQKNKSLFRFLFPSQAASLTMPLATVSINVVVLEFIVCFALRDQQSIKGRLLYSPEYSMGTPWLEAAELMGA